MNSSSQSPSLGEAANRFLASLSPEERKTSQQEVYRFVRWYGWEQLFSRLTVPEVANYAEQLSLSDTDYIKKLELIRAFLVYAREEGWSKSNLTTHLKIKKRKNRSQSPIKQGLPETISLTRQGYTKMEAELTALKNRRLQAIDEMRKAAADKDFRENAPLEAARQQHGQLEGRIRQLEETMKSASIIDEKQEVTFKASIGDNIIMSDLISGEELRYTIVSPREADPTRDKISTASPIGKALLGRGQGEVIEVLTPAGKLRYQIKQVKR